MNTKILSLIERVFARGNALFWQSCWLRYKSAGFGAGVFVMQVISGRRELYI